MKRHVFACLLLATLCACSTNRLGDADNLALYRSHAGTPIKDFRYFGQISGWTPVGNSALAVWTKPDQAYLLELAGPCYKLDFATAISISNMMGSVSAGFDSVSVHGDGPGNMNIPCRIQTIKPLEVKALRQAQSELREAKVVERTAPAS